MEFVVLVDEKNNPVGTMPKDNVHTYTTPLHRGFSLFIFNRNGELLVTRRAPTKKTFPDVWTNTVCGHPGPDEDPVVAAKRRLKDELGIVSGDIKVVAPYRYRFADAHGIVENEMCPILVGHTHEEPVINTHEVGDVKWMPWKEFLVEIQNIPDKYSPWCIEEAAILQQKDLGLQ
jgi:isopentenyl-diphosphate delta-isomerase type 1